MTWTIDDIPPSNNRYIGRQVHPQKYQAEKKRWAMLIDLICRPKPKKPIDRATVTLMYYFPDNRRRDPDNYSGKMILDGLVRSGIIVDDSFAHIDLHIKCAGKANPPRTVVEVIEKP